MLGFKREPPQMSLVFAAPTWDYVVFAVYPKWRRPFLRDRAGRRCLVRYRLVYKPIGADWDQCKTFAKYWTWKGVLAAVRQRHDDRRAYAPVPEVPTA